jgi:hypothetical protein
LHTQALGKCNPERDIALSARVRLGHLHGVQNGIL